MTDQEIKKKFWTSIGLTIVVATALTIWGVYGIGEYGMALFILVPFLIGLQSTLLYGKGNPQSKAEYRKITFSTVGIFLAGLFIFAFEGLICILMAAPIILLLSYAGMLAANSILNNRPGKSTLSIILVIISIPITGFIEKDTKPNLYSVTSEIIIDASPGLVWKNVIAFPQLDEPNEIMFKAGISYPIDARIEGQGVGAIRYCNFNTGSFVEPITEWRENKTLSFDVLQQPAPMTELSFYDINAPHLHDYFVSKKGQFKLIALKNGKTKLQGTTWYENRIKPEFYWNLWSGWIVSSIHERVLKHIKLTTEKKDAH